MDNALHVSPISGDNALLLNGFRIVIVATDEIVNTPILVYRVYRKGLHIETYSSLQEAVEWCK